MNELLVIFSGIIAGLLGTILICKFVKPPNYKQQVKLLMREIKDNSNVIRIDKLNCCYCGGDLEELRVIREKCGKCGRFTKS